MPDSNQQNNNTNQNNTNTNSQNGTTPQSGTNPNIGGSGKKYVIGIDHGGDGKDQQSMETVAQGIESCGNTVEITQVGPNQETYLAGHGADIAVYLCNGVDAWTMWSFVNKIKSGGLPFTIFAMEGWYHNESEPDGSLADMEHVRAEPFQPPHDGDQGDASAMHADSNAQNVGEYVDENSQYIALCYAKTPEEMAQNICSGSCGGGSGTGGGSSSGGSAQVKDKTFENCIKRICAATDSVFLVENNAAVLFPYTDWMAFTLRRQVNKISAKDMDPDLFEINYNTDGFYNKVTVVWGASDEDVAAADEKVRQMQEEKMKSIKDKARSKGNTNTDNQNNQSNQQTSSTTIGNVTTVQKIMPSGGTQLSEQYDPLVKIYGELEKKVTTNFPNEETAHFVMNSLLIQYIRDFNNSCRVRTIHNQKLIGGTFYAVENPNNNEVELFYLNGYTLFKEKDQPLVTDVEFKYGPEGAEEVLDYQAYGGGGGGSTGSTDTSSEEAIWKGTQKACHQWTCGDLRTGESDTQDPKVAEEYYNKNVQAGKKFCLTCYGMSAWLYYQFNYKANIPCRVIGNSGHHVVELFKNNAWYKPTKEYSKYCEEGYRYNDFCKGNAPVLLDAPNPPSGSSTNSNPSGNTANQSNGGNSNG